MGYKIVCFNCRKAFNNNLGAQHNFGKCTECGGEYVYFNHKFRPPRKSDLEAWKVVRFLFDIGFNFQHVVEEHIKIRENGRALDYDIYGQYPRNLKEAQEFITKFKEQAKHL